MKGVGSEMNTDTILSVKMRSVSPLYIPPFTETIKQITENVKIR